MSSGGLAENFDDVSSYKLDGDDEVELLAAQTECTFIWVEPSGQPMGVVMNFIHRRGSFWLTAAARRPRIAAVRADDRVCLSISSKGSAVTARQSVSYAGSCVLHESDDVLDWFIPEFSAAMRPGNPAAAQAFAQHLRHPGRLVLEVRPLRRIGFDSRRMWAAAPTAAPDAPPSQ